MIRRKHKRTIWKVPSMFISCYIQQNQLMVGWHSEGMTVMTTLEKMKRWRKKQHLWVRRERSRRSDWPNKIVICLLISSTCVRPLLFNSWSACMVLTLWKYQYSSNFCPILPHLMPFYCCRVMQNCNFTFMLQHISNKLPILSSVNDR